MTNDKLVKLLALTAAYEQALNLIAAPMRSDGTWNRDRLACQILAKEALAEQKRIYNDKSA